MRPKGQLLRILGVGFGIAMVVGGAIGTGILLTPGLVAAWPDLWREAGELPLRQLLLRFAYKLGQVV